jgi:protein transport protein SEC24
MCNLGPDGRRCDADDRPELCRGTVEFVATKEFMVCDYLACEDICTVVDAN